MFGPVNIRYIFIRNLLVFEKILSLDALLPL